MKKSRCRFVSFHVKAKDDIEAITKKGKCVLMKNCDVGSSSVNQKSTVMNSPKLPSLRCTISSVTVRAYQGVKYFLGSGVVGEDCEDRSHC